MRLVIALALVVALASAANPRHCGTPADGDATYYYALGGTVDAEDNAGCDGTLTNNCAYAVSDLTTANPTSLDVAGSRLEADGSTDYIYLAFNHPDKYYNHVIVFPDRNNTVGVCDGATWSRVTTEETHTVSTLTSCSYKVVYRSVWEDAYGGGAVGYDKCGWESATGASTTLTLDFGVTVTEDIGWNRAGMQSRTITFSHPAQVSFPTQVTAETVNIQVFSPVRTIAAITGQAVTIDETTDTATLELVLFTEVQDPFELHQITQVSTLPAEVSAGTDMTGGNDDGDGTNGIRGTDTCTTGLTDCSSSWTFTYTMSSITGACQFDGAYEVGFVIKCADDTTTNCPIDSATDSVNVDFTIDTSNHCPTVIDTVSLQAWLHVWGNSARDQDKDDFVGDGTLDDGQTADLNDWQVAYFSAPATSTQVQIDYTELNQVWVARAGDDITLLDKDDTRNESLTTSGDDIDGGVVCAPETIGFPADVSDAAIAAQTGCEQPNPADPTNTAVNFLFNFKHGRGGVAAAGANSTAKFEFDIRTDGRGFNMANDAIETMTVHAILDVAYSNAAKRAGGMVMTDGQVNREATASFRFTNGNSGTNAGSGTSSSSALMSGTVLMGAAALAAIAVIAVVAIVVRRRRRAPAMQKVESTAELTTV